MFPFNQFLLREERIRRKTTNSQLVSFHSISFSCEKREELWVWYWEETLLFPFNQFLLREERFDNEEDFSPSLETSFHSISFSCEKRVSSDSRYHRVFPVSIQLVSLARRELSLFSIKAAPLNKDVSIQLVSLARREPQLKIGRAHV